MISLCKRGFILVRKKWLFLAVFSFSIFAFYLLQDVAGMSGGENSSECVSNWECGEWSECSLEYNLGQISGTMERICTDLNNCEDDLNEIQECKVNPIEVDIMVEEVESGEKAKIFTSSGDFLGYIERGKRQGKPYLDIYLQVLGEDVLGTYQRMRILKKPSTTIIDYVNNYSKEMILIFLLAITAYIFIINLYNLKFILNPLIKRYFFKKDFERINIKR